MKPPAFQFYADDFLGGTCDMTQSEVGAYILLLCHQWNRGSIPVQPDRQQNIAKGPVSEHVISKFELQPDGTLKNFRLEQERKKQSDYRDKQRLKGIASGVARRTVVEPRLNHGCNSVDVRFEPETNRKPTLLSPSPSPSPISTPISPKGENQMRAERIFNRKKETPLTEPEKRAFKKSKDAIDSTSESDWLLLEEFYAAPQSETYSRKDLATLVNNWNGEIDRARAWKNKPEFQQIIQNGY